MGEEATQTEETKTEETKVEEKTPTVPTDKGVDLKDEDIRDNLDHPNADQEFQPLFDDEVMSEEMLKGEEDDTTGEEAAGPGPTGDEKSPEKKADEKSDAEKKAEDDAAKAKKAEDDALEKRAKEEGKTVDEIKAEDKAKAEAEAKPDKKDEQIEGLNTALYQERKTTKQLKARVNELELKIADTGKDEPEKDEFKDFKILSNTEYEELLDEDPDEAAKYLYKFNRYQEHQRKIEKGQLDRHKAQSAINELVNDGIEALEGLIPGITKGEAKEEAEKLTDFALKNGFDNEVLSAITDPRTKIVTGDNEVLILSDGAAQIVGAIKAAYDASLFNEDEFKENVEKELRPKIEAEVQKTLIEKLQKDPESGFRSLDMTPGSGLKDTVVHSGPISEGDYGRLSEKERAALLGA